MSIAIAIPSLDQRPFLSAALDSLAVSSEHIYRAVLDGGSTDGTAELLEARSAELEFWRSCPDGGQAAAINEGVARICASHPDVDAVGWLNADDVIVDDGLTRLKLALDLHPGWVAVAGRAWVIAENGSRVGEVLTAPFTRDGFAQACTICQPAALVRREAWERIGGLDASLHLCLDYDLWWRLARLGHIGRVDEFVAASRDHGLTKTRQLRARYFAEATAIVRRETGTVPWHWYISEALERQVAYEVGRRPSLPRRLVAGIQAATAFLRGSAGWSAG
jgi:GT2 family glycosyltransferase